MEWKLHFHNGVEFWTCESGTPVQIMQRIMQLHNEGIDVYPMDPQQWYGARPFCDWIAEY